MTTDLTWPKRPPPTKISQVHTITLHRPCYRKSRHNKNHVLPKCDTMLKSIPCFNLKYSWNVNFLSKWNSIILQIFIWGVRIVVFRDTLEYILKFLARKKYVDLDIFILHRIGFHCDTLVTNCCNFFSRTVRSERLIFSVWCVLVCLFACLLACRQLFQLLTPGGSPGSDPKY